MKAALAVLLLLAVPLAAQITPATPSVAEGQSVSLVSSAAGTWSLKGVGTLTTIDATHATYTAPASVVATHALFGCPVFPSDSIWNTPVNNLPVNSNSSAWISALSTASGNTAYTFKFDANGWGQSYADGSTPTHTVKTYYNTQSLTVPYPSGLNLSRQGGSFNSPFKFAGGFDAHIQTTRTSDCSFFDTYYDASPVGTSSMTYTCSDNTSGCNAQSAAAYSSKSYTSFLPTSQGTTAAGTPLALNVTAAEIVSNSINHVVQMSVGLAEFQFGTFLWPATSTAGGCSGSSVDIGGTPCSTAGPLGMRLRLKSSVSPATVCSAGTDLPSTYCRELVIALQTYGMIVMDTGLALDLYASADTTQDPNIIAAFAKFAAGGLNPLSAAEVVDESSLQSSANSYQVCPNGATCMAGAQTYVTPRSEAIVSNGSNSVSIALFGAAIGFPTLQQQTVAMMTGAYSWTLPTAVIPALSNQAVTWSLVSGGGTLSGNVYTPPATNSTYTNAVLKCTSAADSNVSTEIYINLLPAGSPLRVDVGSSTSTTDANGNVWFADIGEDGGGPITQGTDYPHWNRTNAAASAVYESNAYTYGEDLGMNVVVPNGNYKVHLLFGIPGNGHCNTVCSTFPGLSGYDQLTYGPVMIEAQGMPVLHTDLYYKSGYTFDSPVDVYVPAKVTDNILRVYLRTMGSDSAPTYAPSANATQIKIPLLAGLELLPDTNTPHWSIDSGVTSAGAPQTTISAGQTLQPFALTDWYTGMHDPTWSIVSGPGVMSGSTLSLPAGAQNNGPIVIKAADNNFSATTTISVVGGTNLVAITPKPPVVNHYSFKRAITINHAQVSAAQTNFPVTLSLTDQGLENTANGGHVLEIHGFDIMLASDAAGASPLQWEVEKYDPNAGTWIGHVLIPALSNTADTVIYMFYGNPAIVADQSQPAAVWDSNFTGVYHLASVTANGTADSTSNANNAVRNVSVLGTSNGKIGSAGSFAGSGFHLELPPAVLNAPAGTISAWLNSTQATAPGNNFGVGLQADTGKEFHFMQWSNFYNGSVFGWNDGTDNTMNLPAGTLNIPANAWVQVVYSWNQSANSQQMYLNGAVVNSVSAAFTPYIPVNNFWLGTDPNNQSYAFTGTLDEVRFSNIARSASWVATEYANQNAAGTFASLGSEGAN